MESKNIEVESCPGTTASGSHTRPCHAADVASFRGTVKLTLVGRSAKGDQSVAHELRTTHLGATQAAWIEAVNTIAADLARLIGYEVTIGWRPNAASITAAAAAAAARPVEL